MGGASVDVTLKGDVIEADTIEALETVAGAELNWVSDGETVCEPSDVAMADTRLEPLGLPLKDGL